ncbi:MAG TPA: histidine phosphatase family protein [Actinophytocola sp.]|uniref:SixA phosphatase family protein n=1 Tax=Actinophytocola sp. TaxID=1872138 RepID=UPI002DB6F40C|nr:histidine phosphatase family protein [Actinophytocola sp.]HEU5473264.1 histidine phosphatase family protein [Actinophytocola sp.]
MTERRTLVVVRHAKSDWSGGELDYERPLAERGRRDAPALGGWLAEHVKTLDLVVCSPATRARQTWQLAGARLDPRPSVRHDERMYGAGPTELLTVLAELPDEIERVALVGHNPGLADLVARLSGEQRELKTAAVAVLSWPGSWVDAEFSTATVDAYATVRG